MDIKIFAALFGSLLSLLFFFQKQRLEETRLFREIFTECNKSFDKLNENLNKIINKGEDESISDDERYTLYDYFNLCGEEYLYYKKGYIYPSAWKAWHNGMKIYIKSPRVLPIWEKEIKSDSYYGLKIDIK